MGDLLCLNAANGNVIWSKNLHTDKAYEASVQTWGFSGNPLIDGDKLICLVGGENSIAVAFHKDTGKEIWRALSASSAGYGSPVIVSAGGQRQLIIWNPDSVNSLDPETGKLYWTQKFTVRQAMSIPTPRQAGDLLLVSCFYDGAMMMKLDADKPGATVAWKVQGRGILPQETHGLHSVMATPFVKDGYIYGVCSHGELRCLKADTGERVWSTFQATTKGEPVRWANAFLVAHEGKFFLFNETGDLIIARLTPKGYEEVSRAHLLEPTNKMAGFGIGRPSPVVWSHPAFANKSVYARNDKEIVCASLAK
jgi:outer membrane protein assembly factor BamB